MTSWVRAGPTFTLATDRLAESDAGIGDGDLQPTKLAMQVRFPSPAPPVTAGQKAVGLPQKCRRTLSRPVRLHATRADHGSAGSGFAGHSRSRAPSTAACSENR